MRHHGGIEIRDFNREKIWDMVFNLQTHGNYITTIEEKVFAQNSVRIIYNYKGETYEIESWAGQTYLYLPSDHCYNISYIWEKDTKNN